MRIAMGIILIALSARALAQTDRPTSLPSSQIIPRPALDQMYRAELGRLYSQPDAEKYFQAHRLIERYFASSEERRNLVRELDAIGLNPNIVGRLTRLRMNWPQLAGGVYYINERQGPHEVRYFLGLPKTYDRTKSWPLVIKLPTADAFVTDPRPDPEQVTQIYSRWMTEELAAHPDAVLIMPLLNLDELWGPSQAGMNSVIQPILHSANRVNIDPARVYLIGHAMSGHAAWNLSLNYTTYFSAFNVMAGAASGDWQRLRLMNLRNVLPVVWHDVDDLNLRVDQTRQLVKVLRDFKIDIDYVETRNVGHVPSPAIAEQGYKTARARTRQLYPKQVAIQSNRPETIFNRNDWVQMYQPISPGEEKNMIIPRSSEYMTVFTAAFSVDATIDRNVITATSKNAASMRFYLNDQMIDFNRAVVVNVNRRPRVETILKPSTDEMLKDQLFMGRGWRYYTAVIDIDFGAAADRPATRPSTRP